VSTPKVKAANAALAQQNPHKEPLYSEPQMRFMFNRGVEYGLLGTIDTVGLAKQISDSFCYTNGLCSIDRNDH
jgi:hypothetical protein